MFLAIVTQKIIEICTNEKFGELRWWQMLLIDKPLDDEWVTFAAISSRECYGCRNDSSWPLTRQRK